MKFEEFYHKVYLKEHTHPVNRWIHFLSNLGVVLFVAMALSLWRWEPLAVALALQLIPPFLGHLFFEGSHQSIDDSPLYSALGSWRMFWDVIRGRRAL